MRRRAPIDGEVVGGGEEHTPQPRLGGEFAGAPWRRQGQPEVRTGTVRRQIASGDLITIDQGGLVTVMPVSDGVPERES